jgi:hypothetical protein
MRNAGKPWTEVFAALIPGARDHEQLATKSGREAAAGGSSDAPAQGAGSLH